MDDRDPSLPGLCCVLLTSDELLVARARVACRQGKVPLIALDSVDAVRGVLASVIPSHIIVDARHADVLDPDALLGPLRPKVRVVHVHGLETAMSVLAAIAAGG